VKGFQYSNNFMHIIDSHIHCGVQNVCQPFEMIQPLLEKAGIAGACLFAPVEDIYDRYDPAFDDTPNWEKCRHRAHDYLLDLAARHRTVIPYFFVWNDFNIDGLKHAFRGIKWHHHAGEPPYHYADSRCTQMIDAICDKKLPIVLEETFERTLLFINQVAERTPIIIPHLGMLNGGFETLLDAGVWDNPAVYADTALASPHEITSFLKRYGAGRLIFGSDFPFGLPGPQLEGLRRLDIAPDALEAICSENILKLIKPN